MKSRRFKTLSCAALAIACLAPAGANALEPLPTASAYGFIDRNGEVVVLPACDRVTRSGDWASLERDGKLGFANLRTGQSTGLIFKASELASWGDLLFSRGLAAVGQNGKYGYVDRSGRTIIPFRYELAGRFEKDGLAVVKLDGKFGYIDQSGAFVIPPRYDFAGQFAENGLAVVAVGGKRGYIDRLGASVIPPRFDGAGDFNESGLARVRLGQFWGAIDRHGRLVIPAKFDMLQLPSHGDLVIVRSNGRDGVFDAQGRLVVPIKFVSIRPFGQNGLAAASLDVHPLMIGTSGHWGFIDRAGRFVIPPIYSSVTDFEDEQHRKDFAYASFQAPLGLAAAQSVDAAGVETTLYIDQRGRTVMRLPTGITGGHVNKNGVIMVFDGREPHDNSLGHRFGFFDPAKPAVPTAWFDATGDFGDGDLAPVLLDSGWGYADRSGHVVIAPQFRSAAPFTAEGLASVLAKDPATGRYSAALIDRTGKVRLQTPFDAMSPFGDSNFAVVLVNRQPAWAPIAMPADQCAVRPR